MCGIAGYLSKREDPEPVGRIMLDMLTSLARRGPDSAGMALFRTEPAHREACWIRLPETGDPEDHERRILAGLATVGKVGNVEQHHGLLRVELATVAGPAAIRAAAERGSDDVEVVSLGRQLELVKQVGHPERPRPTRSTSQGLRGSHAHRPHPPVHREPGGPDPLAALLGARRGGHRHGPQRPHHELHKLRRLYEQRGVRFFTENDSEVIGVYLADQLDRGLSLEEALAASLDDLDGSFTYLVATRRRRSASPATRSPSSR